MVGRCVFFPGSPKCFLPKMEKRLSEIEFFLNWQKCPCAHSLSCLYVFFYFTGQYRCPFFDFFLVIASSSSSSFFSILFFFFWFSRAWACLFLSFFLFSTLFFFFWFSRAFFFFFWGYDFYFFNKFGWLLFFVWLFVTFLS